MEVDDDVRDVERVLAGDVDAFAGIVRRWQGPLVNLASCLPTAVYRAGGARRASRPGCTRSRSTTIGPS
jgi:hypothetical protein